MITKCVKTTILLLVLLLGILLMTGCRAVYINSVHNERTTGEVNVSQREQVVEDAEAQMGKTTTVETSIPVQEETGGAL